MDQIFVYHYHQQQRRRFARSCPNVCATNDLIRGREYSHVGWAQSITTVGLPSIDTASLAVVPTAMSWHSFRCSSIIRSICGKTTGRRTVVQRHRRSLPACWEICWSPLPSVTLRSSALRSIGADDQILAASATLAPALWNLLLLCWT